MVYFDKLQSSAVKAVNSFNKKVRVGLWGLPRSAPALKVQRPESMSMFGQRRN